MKKLFMVCMLLAVFDTTSAFAQVTILVNPGPFSSIEKAASGEKQVNWVDSNLTDDRACTECFAAKQLAHFLVVSGLAEKENIKLAVPDNLPPEGNVFLIGSINSNPLIVKHTTCQQAELKTKQSFCITANTDDKRTITIIEGKDRQGTLYGVYDYLEQLGFAFYGLGELGTLYPSEPVELPQTLKIIENPSFVTRGFYCSGDFGNETFFLWMARNRINYWTNSGKWFALLKKYGVKVVSGGHSVQNAFLGPHTEYPYNHPDFKGDEDKPRDPYALREEYIGDVNDDGKLTYFEAHPEWYGLIDGKRTDKTDREFGSNFCMSNPDASKELAKNLVQNLIDGSWKHTDIVDFWTMDVGKWCECENCKNAGTPSDLLLGVTYIVQKEIKNARRQGRLHRDILFGTLAYVETIPAPIKPLPDDFEYDTFFVTFFPIERCYAHTLADPACTEINEYMRESYLGWAKGGIYKGTMLIGEYYNVSSLVSMPVVFTKVLAADIPWYYRTGTRHFHYMHTPMRRWGTWTLNQRLMAELLWNVEINVEDFLNNFFERYYPTTTKHTRKFYEYLEDSLANVKTFKHLVHDPHGPGTFTPDGSGFYQLRQILAEDDVELFPLEHLKYESHHPTLDDAPDIVDMIDILALARKEIDAALIECKDEKEKQRLLEAEQRFAYGEAIAHFYYRLIRTALFHRRGDQKLARNECDYVEQLAKSLESVTDLVHVSSSTGADAENGLKAALHWPTGTNPYEYFKEKYGKQNVIPQNQGEEECLKK